MKKLMWFVLVLFVSTLQAEFDFGSSGDGCEGGNGSFEQMIENFDGDYEKAVTVGTIPKGITDTIITLKSENDVDIRLYDANGTKIVHWPLGILSGPDKESTYYNGVKIEYSGYNGDGTHYGYEYIKIIGTTQNDFVMKAFGYQAGYAQVEYSWKAKEGCEDGGTPNPSGNGSFEQQIFKGSIVDVGDIPPGVSNLYISLESDNDVDIQLYDKDDDVAIIAWPHGLLSGPTRQVVDYKGMKIEWSGYNGDGINLGHEYIKIYGDTSCNLSMKAFGYAAGYAKVYYEWGDDSGSESEPTKIIDKIEVTPLNSDELIVGEDISFVAYTEKKDDIKLYIQFYTGEFYLEEKPMMTLSNESWVYVRSFAIGGEDRKFKIIVKDLDGNVLETKETTVAVAEKHMIDLPYKGSYKITQGNNAATSHYDHGAWDNTYAIDIAMPLNTKVLSPVDGTIYKVYDENHNGGCLGGGRVVVIKDLEGNFLTFLHLRSIVKNQGEEVHKGDLVAYSGGSKGSDGTCINNGFGYHLHFHLWSGVGSPDSHTIPFDYHTKLRVAVGDNIEFLYGSDLDDENIVGKYFTSLLK